MAPDIENRQGKPEIQSRQLCLIYSDRGVGHQTKPGLHHSARSPTRLRFAVHLTNAIMCRLWIPQGSTIVGLLEVGSSKSNYYELLKWVIQEMPSMETDDPHRTVIELTTKFLQGRVTTHYSALIVEMIPAKVPHW